MFASSKQHSSITHWQYRVLILFALSVLVGCQISPTQPPATVHLPGDHQILTQAQALQLLYQQHADWQGTPYRIGGVSRAGIDCSAFVQVTYRDLFGIDLPRTTDQQLRAGQRISRKQLQPGDLLFFRRGGHVGLYLENNRFLHASTSRGVMISDIQNHYWTRQYWRAVRIR